MADAQTTFLDLLGAAIEWSEAVTLIAIRPDEGTPAAADIAAKDDYLTPEGLSLVEGLFDTVILDLVVAGSHARAIAALVASDATAVGPPTGVLTRAASEASGHVLHLLDGTDTHERLHRFLALRLDALAHLNDGLQNEDTLAAREDLRDVGNALGFDLGPKRLFDTAKLSPTKLLELPLPPDPVRRALRSYLGAFVHSMPTATSSTHVDAPDHAGVVRPGFKRSARQENVFLALTAWVLTRASTEVERWASRSIDPAGNDLRERCSNCWGAI